MAVQPSAISRSINLGPAAFSGAWIVVAGMFLASLVVQGTILGGITLFDEHLLRVLGIPSAELKARDSIFLVAAALSCFSIATVCRAIGVRQTMCLGLLLLSGALLTYSLAPPLLVIYGLHVVLGFSLATVHVVTIMIILSRWFAADDPRKGIALGLTVAGASCGAVAMSQFIAWCLAGMDWQTVFRVVAILPIALLPIVWFTIRPPRDIEKPGWQLSPGGGAGFRAALKALPLSRDTAHLLIVILPIFYVSAGVVAHTVLLLRSQGLDLQAAAGGVSTLFLMGLIGKVASGFFLIRFSLHATWYLYLGAMVAGSLIVWLAGADYPHLAIGLIGFGWGGCFPLTQLRIAAAFPGSDLPRILGVFVVLESIGSASGAWVTALLFDRTGSYDAPLAVNVALLVLASLFSWSLPDRTAKRAAPAPQPQSRSE